MKFKKDIFISYAHIDDESLTGDKPGWISNFHRSLEIRLSQLLGERPIIWRDSSLRGNHDFDKEIISQFSNVAIFLAILTPRYTKSEWCTKEVTKFTESTDKNIGLLVNNKSRILKVIKTPVEINNQQEILQKILGYEFYKKDENSRVSELNQENFGQSGNDYWRVLDDVAHDIVDLLKDIKNSSKESEKINNNSISVFLSETSSDAKSERENLRRWLQEKKIVVKPTQSLSYVANEYINLIEKDLLESDYIIQILGDQYGLVLEGTVKSNIHLQFDSINKISQTKNKKTFLWSSPKKTTNNGLINDERKINFNSLIDEKVNTNPSIEYIKNSFEDFKYVIEQELITKEDHKSKKDNITNNDDPLSIYIICEEKELTNLSVVEDLLFDNGYNVIFPLFGGDVAELREDHLENLKSCDIVLIFFSQENEVWIRSKLRDLMRIKAYGRNEVFISKIILMGGEINKRKERFRQAGYTTIIENDKSMQLLIDHLKSLNS